MVSAQGRNHCVDLMALFTKIASLVVRACAKLRMVAKVYKVYTQTAARELSELFLSLCYSSRMIP